MTVLVTGSRGKVGSALIALLHQAGADVRAAPPPPGRAEQPPDRVSKPCNSARSTTRRPSLPPSTP